MAKRDFLSVALVGDSESGFKLTAVATDGTAWIANLYRGDILGDETKRSLEVKNWSQIKPLPED